VVDRVEGCRKVE